MGRELLKWLAALGVGVLGVIGAHLANMTPPAGADPITNVVITLVLAVLKRGVDYLVAKVPAAPVDDEPVGPAGVRRKTSAGV